MCDLLYDDRWEATLESQNITTPLKSILITGWSQQHITGHDLNGGAIVSYAIDTTLLDTEVLGHDIANWSQGDIATLTVDAETHEAQLRNITPKEYVVRVREFQIVDITQAVHSTVAGQDDQARHIYLKGTAVNGKIYVMPMMGYTIWRKAWELTDLLNALKKAEILPPPDSTQQSLLSHSMVTETIDGAQLGAAVQQFNNIFYSSSKNVGTSTVFDNAASFAVTTLSVTQNGPGTRAEMFVAAFVKRTIKHAIAANDEAPQAKKGTAFSPPYFVIDGEKIFIRVP